MIVKLTLDDLLFEQYEKKYSSPNCYKKMKDAIEAFKDVEIYDRVLLINGEARRALEAVFGTTIDNVGKLVRLSMQLNRFSIQGVEVTFTPDQLARLDAQAGFHGRTREVYIREMVEELKSRFMDEF